MKKFENPLEKQLDQYKKIVFYIGVMFCILWVYVTTYYNVPELNYSQILGDAYLGYVLSDTMMLCTFIGLWVAFGMMFQIWIQKKAVDVQLSKLGDISGILSKEKENSEEE